MGLEPPNSSAEGRYLQILESAPDAMILVGQDEVIDFANAQAETLFGYPRSELIGEKLATLIPERFRPNHSAHQAGYFASPNTRPMGSGIELFGRRKDGSEVPVEISLSPVHYGGELAVAAAIRDISERKRMRAIAQLNADRLASAVENIQDAFALFDAEGRLVLCNSAYRGLLAAASAGPLVGRSFEELLDAWMPELSVGEGDDRARFHGERLAAWREPKATFDVRTRDGRSLRVTHCRTPEGGMVMTIWDLTDDVRLADELSTARNREAAASAAKSEFLASMSHELRTPLNAVLGFAQLLQRDKKEPLSARHRERVDQILKGGEHLLRLIDDVLDLSRIESGSVAISTEPVAVSDTLNELKTTLSQAAQRAGLTIVIAPVGNDVPMLEVDRTRLLQILTNFGSNAIKYNRPGGTVTVRVSRPSEGRVRIAVEDTGVGIAAENHIKLFQAFQRAGQEFGPIEGTGIGLLITKRLAALMGAEVGFESERGVGSTFWLDAPIESQPHRQAVVSSDVASGAPSFGATSRKLLYVEDNPANVAFMRDLIDGLALVELCVAFTAEEGIAIARTLQPDVIIMDINLPGMSGLDALRALRADPVTADIPVIALTAAASERDKQRGMEAGFYRYLTKPVNVEQLIGALERVVAPGA